MLAPFALALTILSDPRPALVELQLAGRPMEALVRVEKQRLEQPEASRALGLDYLRGHLLSLLGRSQEASAAFADAMVATPKLALHSRYRLALEEDRQGHPEMAAGLVATVAASITDRGSQLLPDSVRLLTRTLTAGGDCRLLGGLHTELLPTSQRRQVILAQADCALRLGFVEMARSLLEGILREGRQDDSARGAAERLAALVSTTEQGPLPLLLGFTFHVHREFERASEMLRRALTVRPALTWREAFDAQLTLGRSQLSQQQFTDASATFAGLVVHARSPEERAQGLYWQGRSFELQGNWAAADTSYRQAHRAQPAGGPWSSLALLAALRIEWRSGGTETAKALHDVLWSRPEWRREACRAALFLGVSDVVQGRRERAKGWLDRTSACNPSERIEASYWQGRLAELSGNPARAVAHYGELLRADAYHPLARSASFRLLQPGLVSAALAEGRRLAASVRPEDLFVAWQILGPIEPREAQAAQAKLAKRLAADPRTAPYLALAQRPVQKWPLWSHALDSAEEMLLALGMWREGAAQVALQFPATDPGLGYTGAELLARGGETARGIEMVERMRARTPKRLPASFLPRPLRRLQYPFPYREVILAEGKIRGVPTHLLAALIREESRFDKAALSPASARGLTQLSVPTARRLAEQLKLERLQPEDLYRPQLSIVLGAAQLGILLRQFSEAPSVALSAYAAGEREAISWRRYCFSGEPEEYLTKIGTDETRDYVRRVLTAQAQYAELYP